jgi:hypothetical protein
MKCVKCGTPYTLDSAVCLKCGHVLFDPKSSTVALRIDPNVLRLRRQRAQTGMLRPQSSISLLIRGIAERFVCDEGTEIILGRTDLISASPTHFDLTRYGGHDRGVSRTHAVLRFLKDGVTITDMNSANGTFVNGTRLEPNNPQLLKDNDEIRLGSLTMIVRFDGINNGASIPGLKAD